MPSSYTGQVFENMGKELRWDGTKTSLFYHMGMNGRYDEGYAFKNSPTMDPSDTNSRSCKLTVSSLRIFSQILRIIEIIFINRIVGEGRLPDHSDRDALVYVQVVIHEVQRWQPITPTAIVHHVNVEDKYKRYRIPKDSTIIPNIWAILHNEAMYPDPYTFNPERWIKDGKINPDIRDITTSFGFGRR
ncbi:hypothetical protein PM082_018723 [Marasmius tenuissimus]|nr:hypothetical protein PM082_018723 [Marasmius tenuissimus]